jgi:reverse gyrase
MISTGGLPYPSLIFVQSIDRANELYRTLVLDGLLVDVVHGERSKSKREEAIKAFREGSVWALVVTDVLARGMDFRGVRVVVNYGWFRVEEVGATLTVRLSPKRSELHSPHRSVAHQACFAKISDSFRSNWSSRSSRFSSNLLQSRRRTSSPNVSCRRLKS